ncbi:MAG: CpsD/CapB family tyrosine-protein kinase [Phycisphaerae bacterium]|nr:CpsD/CapB family tyrosine-protein kinase [Phycisphaerae bacterium]
MANVWDALKKHQSEPVQAESTTASPGAVPLAVPADVAVTPHPAGAAASSVSAPTNAPPLTAPLPSTSVVPVTSPTARKPAAYSEELRPHFDRGGRIADAYRALRTNLLAKCGEKGFCYLVTSARGGEGKTITSVNLALVLAECVTKNTLLIDADLRRPRVAGLMGLSAAPGLAELIRGEAAMKQVLQPTTYPNLSVISAGGATPESVAELLARPPVASLLAEAKRMFDYVLIDTPPINHVSDVGTLGPFCRGALLVVRSGKTRQEDVDRAVALLHAANIQPAGMVLTGSRGFAANG